MAPRSAPVLGPPPADLGGFPRRTVRRNRRLYRAHARANGPWWFSSDLTGRLDLPLPHGTCYLAEEPETALRERVGSRLLYRGRVTRALAAGTVVSTLVLPEPHRVADCACPEAADFTVTAELSACAYALAQAWAAAFHAHGFGGVRYLSRFAPSGTSVAVFGSSGPRDAVSGWAVDPAPTDGEAAAVAAGLEVVRDRPPAEALTFATPPRRGSRRPRSGRSS